MTRDEIISGLEREIKSIRREPRGKMLGICMTADEAEDIVALLKEQEALAVREDKVNKCVCGNEINRYWHPEYCGFCGKKLEWY